MNSCLQRARSIESLLQLQPFAFIVMIALSCIGCHCVELRLLRQVALVEFIEFVGLRNSELVNKYIS